MKQCVECGGVVPQQAERCPNCVVTARSSGSRLIKTGVFTTLLITTSYCVPVYGAPCTARELEDGGRGCQDVCETAVGSDGGSAKDDPESGCYQPDGGAP